jgi:UDP-GlcNAc:undecaprenyl-phosphate GlcNAc-1-phosphate transferase
VDLAVLAISFLFSAGLSLLLTPLGIRLAWVIGYLDHPEARKLHTSATALLGGAVVFAVAFTVWLAAHVLLHRPADSEATFLIGGALVALLLGLWDDRFGMNPVFKLVGQATAAGIILASGAVPDFGLGFPWDGVIAVLGVVALMNAVNFLDNMNGMVAGLAAIALVGFGLLSAARGASGLAAAQFAVSGACVGFLRYNFPRARVFLGDAGSLFLGYSLGASAILALGAIPRGWSWPGPLLILAYPAFDMIFVVVNRLREGRKVYVGGKDHSNHRIARILKCQKTTVILIWVSGAAPCASGLVVLSLNRPEATHPLLVLWTGLFLWTGLRLSSEPSLPHDPPPRP